MTMFPFADNYVTPEQKALEAATIASRPPATATMQQSLALISGSAVFGLVVLWLLHSDRVIEFIAYFLFLGTGLFGIAAGWAVYAGLNKAHYPRWTRLTSAIVIGLALFLSASILIRSHKLVRYVQQIDKTTEDNADSEP